MRRAIKSLVLVLLVVLAVAALWQRHELRKWQDLARQARLDAVNAEARADTSRIVTVVVDTGRVQAAVRRAVQERERADRLDDALRQERAARLTLSARVDSLSAVVTGGATTEEDGVRRGDFALRQVPYTIDAVASLPPPPTSGTLEVNVKLDSIPLEVRVGCGPGKRGEVRPAQVSATGPEWAALRVGASTVSPDVCSPEPERGPSRLTWAGVGAALATAVFFFFGR